MTDSRRNIKCSEATFERLTALREDKQWDVFLNELASVFEQQGEDTSAADLSTVLEELDLLPDRVATAVEQSLRGY